MNLMKGKNRLNCKNNSNTDCGYEHIPLSVTRQWYLDRGMLKQFNIKYICSKCKYFDCCAYSVKDEIRNNCSEFKMVYVDALKESSWYEMSYYHLDSNTNKKITIRLSDNC